MYEAKYQKYVTKNNARFAEADEIKKCSTVLKRNGSASGIPLYYDGESLYVDNADNHTIVIGPTGCKKSRTTAFSTVASIIEGGESAVINDPKGEIYRYTAGRAKEKGADVYVLNFREPGKSDFWNPLSQALRFYERDMKDESLQCVADFAETVIKPCMENTNDMYWPATAKVFLISLVLVLMTSVKDRRPKAFNLSNLIPFCYQENMGYFKSLASKLESDSTIAFGLHAVLDLDAEKTRSCIYSTLLSAISPFMHNQSLLTMLSDNSFDIESLSKKQTLIYVIYPDEKDDLNFLVNLFFTQCYETLAAEASHSVNGKLNIRVNFVLDEFSNLAPITNFDNRISEARGKNIRYFLFVQSYSQLRRKYDDCAETILSNCSNWICFSSKETEFLDKLSKICGREVDCNGIEHELLPASEMQYFIKCNDSAEVLIIKQGQYPFVTALPDFVCVGLFKDYMPTDLPFIKATSNAIYYSFSDWVDRVNGHILNFPSKAF